MQTLGDRGASAGRQWPFGKTKGEIIMFKKIEMFLEEVYAEFSYGVRG